MVSFHESFRQTSLPFHYWKNKQISPDNSPALNQGEAQFVRTLGSFGMQKKNNSMANKEIYVLRTLSKGKE